MSESGDVVIGSNVYINNETTKNSKIYESNETKKIKLSNKKNSRNEYTIIRDKIIPKINKVLTEGDIIDNKIGYEAIFNYIKTVIKTGVSQKDPEKIKSILDDLNNMTSQLNTKKLYTSYSKTKLNEYDELSFLNKLNEIIIPKQVNIINENIENSNGGNCHNWTLLYKEIFDELNIETDIILFEPETAHSLLLINIYNKYFIADTEGQKKFNFVEINIGDIIDIGNDYKAEIINKEPFKVDITCGHANIIDNFKPITYTNKKDFIDFIDNKKRDYFLLEYNKINENGEKKLVSFMINIVNGNIRITIEGIFKKKKILNLGKEKIQKGLNNIEAIEFISKKTKTNIFKDPEIESEIKGIIKKIPDGFIDLLL